MVFYRIPFRILTSSILKSMRNWKKKHRKIDKTFFLQYHMTQKLINIVPETELNLKNVYN